WFRAAGQGVYPARQVPGQGRSNSPSLTPRVNASHSSGVNASTGPSGFEESRIRYSFSAPALCGQRDVSVVTVTSTQQGPGPQWLARRQPEVCVSTAPGYCSPSGQRVRWICGVMRGRGTLAIPGFHPQGVRLGSCRQLVLADASGAPDS